MGGSSGAVLPASPARAFRLTDQHSRTVTLAGAHGRVTVLAFLFSWSVVSALSSQGFNHFSPAAGQLIVIVVLAALAGVVAAIWPARRASRLNVLEAITTE